MADLISHGRPDYRGARPAFTLAEVAACSLIIGALFTILQPSLQGVRDESRQALCLERLHGIASASHTYAAGDPGEVAIPVHPQQFCQCPGQPCGSPCMEPFYIGAYEWGGKSGIGSPGHPYAIERGAPTSGPDAWQSSRYGTAAGFGPASRPMNRILYPHGFRDNTSSTWDPVGSGFDTKLKLNKFRCPADDGPPRGAHCSSWVMHSTRSSYDHFGTSYAANVFMIASSGGGYMQSNSPYMRALSGVPDPARTTLYEENVGRWAWACKKELPECNFLGAGVDPGPTKAVRGWHGKNWTFNHTFTDGHAAPVKVYIEGTADQDGFAEHRRIEQVFEDPAQQERYRCVIIRGDGWQKDTLPADPVDTGLWHGGYGRPSYEGCVQSD